MRYYYIELYARFACLAGDCPSTCCAGWQISVDREAMERYRALPDRELREDILGHILYRDGGYYFKNDPDGRCPMLDRDGSCRIQKRTEEKMLCVTCRKYPRLIGHVGREMWMSMAASCPVVADYLWRQPPRWIVVEDGQSRPAAANGLEPVQRRLRWLEDPCHFFCSGGQKKREQILRRYRSMIGLAAGCLDILALTPGMRYLEGSFDYFGREERDISAVYQDLEEFESVWGGAMERFYFHYLPYRIYSRYLEMPDEPEASADLCILGEAALFYVIRFSRSRTLEGRAESRMPGKGTEGRTLEGRAESRILEELTWVYRFCAHGKVAPERFKQLLEQNFGDAGCLARTFGIWRGLS